ncbi:SDR family oxidoreductase [Enterococcus sp. BWB1-3]|uniref:NAD-dependent epimerase/dehydratase family protein n=1 Tax=Enterococcus sp. BWB1-3 TaxID=2787713 RepID=UPI0019246210|nr:NAD-dependent epimerase/dehydratase family protein [Enterococcus sp. BWB1-3]MBL1230700.1 SDR family oxidoreductase [Enterococcus sp. BWB1-3]
MNKKNVLLIGGTGAMGVYLVPELLQSGYRVYVTSRRKIESENENLFYIQGNGHDLEFVKEICDGNTISVIIDFMVYSTIEFEERCESLLELSSHYFFLSSYRVFANQDEVITERSPKLLDVVKDSAYLKTDEYALTKARQEVILRNASKRNWTIIRPSITYSKERFQLGALEANLTVGRALRQVPTIIAEPMLDKSTTMTWAGDVAKMIVGLIGNKKSLGEDFNVVTAEHHTWKEVADYYNQVIHLDCVPINLNDYMRITKRKWQVLYDRLYDRVLDNSKILAYTGLRQENFKPLLEGLKDELGKINRSRYLNSQRSWEFHAALDYHTNSRVNLTNVADGPKGIYLAEIKRLEELSIDGSEKRIARFDIAISNSLWKARALPWNDYTELVRIHTHVLGKPSKGENRWVNIRLGQLLQQWKKYKLKLVLKVSGPDFIKPFLSGGGNIQKLEEISVETDQWRTVEYDIIVDQAGLEFLSFTATDIPISGNSISIKKCLVSKVDV